MKVLSFQKLNAIAACDDVSISKRNLNALIARAVLVTRLPSPLEEVINSAIKMWVMYRKRGCEPPLGSAPKRARALTLREHAIADALTRGKPLFVKTVLGQPPSRYKKNAPRRFRPLYPSRRGPLVLPTPVPSCPSGRAPDAGLMSLWKYFPQI